MVDRLREGSLEGKPFSLGEEVDDFLDLEFHHAGVSADLMLS